MSNKENAVATHLTDEQGNLPLWLKLTYSMPRFSFRAAYVVQSTYVNLFYLSVGGSIAYLAFFIAFARSLDVVTDPSMAWWTDNGCRTRFGRRKPFLFVGMFLYNICWVMFLTPPDLGHPGVSIWFGIFFTAFYLCDTLTQIPYLAFGTEFTNSYTERNSLWFYCNGAGNVGTLFGMAIPALLQAYLDQRSLMTITGLVFACVHVVGLALIMKFIKEIPPWEMARTSTVELHEPVVANDDDGDKTVQTQNNKPHRTTTQTKAQQLPFVVSFLRTIRNRAFSVLVKSYMLDYFSAGMIGAMMPFYVQYVLLEVEGGQMAEYDRGFEVLGYIAVAFFCSVVMGMPMWLWLGKRLDKRTAWLAYSAVNALTNFWFYFVGHSVPWAIVVAAINGIAFGGQFYMESVVADVVEYDNFLHGDKIEGMFQAIGSFIPKAALVFSSSLPLSLIAALGFVNNSCPYRIVDDVRVYVDETCLETCTKAIEVCVTSMCAYATDDQCDTKAPEKQPQSVQNLIMWLYCLVPAALACLSFFWKYRYPIKSADVMRKIQEGREKHERGELATDPLTGNSISPVCIAKVDDDEQRDELMTLAHLDQTTVRKYLYMKDGTKLACRLKFNLVIAVSIFLAAVITLGLTIERLNDTASSWLPTFACIIAGADMTVLFVCFSRFRLISRLKAVRQETIELYLAKDTPCDAKDTSASSRSRSNSNSKSNGQYKSVNGSASAAEVGSPIAGAGAGANKAQAYPL